MYDQYQPPAWPRQNPSCMGPRGPGPLPPHVAPPGYAPLTHTHSQMPPMARSPGSPHCAPVAITTPIMHPPIPHPNLTMSQRVPVSSPGHSPPQRPCQSPVSSGSPGSVTSQASCEEAPSCCAHGAERQTSSIANLRLKAKEHSAAMGMAGMARAYSMRTDV